VGLEFRVEGVGLSVYGLGVLVYGLRCRVWGVAFAPKPPTSGTPNSNQEPYIGFGFRMVTLPPRRARNPFAMAAMHTFIRE